MKSACKPDVITPMFQNFVMLNLAIMVLVANSQSSATAQTLTNGGNHHGLISTNNISDTWMFAANANDHIVMRMASIGFPGQFLVYNATGALLTSSGGGSDVYREFTTTSNSLLTVVISSFSSGGTGSYVLHYAKFPGDYTVADDGGLLTNGGNHPGTNELADLDLWTFTADADERIILRLGTVGFLGYLELYGQGGTLLKSTGGGKDSELSYTTTNSGNFTVLMGSYFGNGTGPYVLHYAKVPGSFVVEPTDQGGPMNGSSNYFGQIDLADLDLWTFFARKGEIVNLRLYSTNFNGYMRLYGPAGPLLTSSGGSANITLGYTTTNSGTFTLLVSSWNAEGAGSYQLNVNGLSSGLKFFTPLVSGTNLVLGGTGGISGTPFTILTHTNAAAPLALWTPLSTNLLDSTGRFSETNSFNSDERARFFIIRQP